MSLLLKLFYEFFKTGLFAVGGGMATVPFLYSMSDKTGWFTYNQLADMIAVAESTPGPIGVNMATYVGFTTAGVVGALVATMGLITPSIIVILIVASILQKFRENEIVNSAFYGLRPCSVGLIATACVLVMKTSLLDLDTYNQTGVFMDAIKWPLIVMAVIFYILTNYVPKVKKFHPIVFLLASAVIGIVFNFSAI